MRVLIALWCVAALAAAEGANAPADDAEHQAKLADIRQLMLSTGADKLGVQVMQQMIPALKQAIPDAPDEFWERFAKKVDPNDLIELVVPIYDKHLSHEDITAALAFYRTPAGERTIAVMPQIMHDCMAAGQAWGAKLGRQAAAEVEAERAKQQQTNQRRDDAAKPDTTPHAGGDDKGAP
jgi:hypothetical protein